MSVQPTGRAFVRKARRALARMSPLQRAVFLAMRFEEGVTYAALAQRHAVSEVQVQQAFAMALFLLSRALREPEPRWRQLWPRRWRLLCRQFLQRLRPW